MSKDTIIAWTDHTFNIVWGCAKVSSGCANCYAEAISLFRGWPSQKVGNPAIWGPNAARRVLSDGYWEQPRQWNTEARRKAGIRGKGIPHLVFCSSMCDVFEDHPTVNEQRERLWPLIRETPFLDWQILTKRPDNFRRFLPKGWPDAYPNAWLGVTVEDAKYRHRADLLRATPAAFRFVSYEPALGPLGPIKLDGLGLIIFGGEAGPKHRHCDLAWAEEMRQHCKGTNTTFFFKQSGGPRTETGIRLNGQLYRTIPSPRKNPILQGQLLYEANAYAIPQTEPLPCFKSP